MKICRVVTVPFFLQHHLREQIIATVRAGHDLTLVCADGPELEALRQIPGVRIHRVEIPRQISPWRDLKALLQLIGFFRRSAFDVVHSATPKAGMLAALAGWLTRVPVRLHTFTGQPWMELTGPKRVVAKAGDWVTAHFTTLCYSDSPSQTAYLIAEKVASAKGLLTLGMGSLAGVDTTLFSREAWEPFNAATRADLGIGAAVPVVTFIGRITVDKGVCELVAAARQLWDGGLRFMVVLVGPLEPERDPLPEETLLAIASSPFLCATGYSAQPQRFLAIADVMCLPSYREGFGNVVIEAAAMGVPAVGTDIVGLRDSIVADETGLLVPPRSVPGLAAALARMLQDDVLRRQMAQAAQARALAHFTAMSVNALVLAEYSRLGAAAKAGRHP